MASPHTYPSNEAISTETRRADWLGIGASTLCVLHCLFTPVILTLVSAAFGHELLWLDLIFLGVAIYAAFTVGRKGSWNVRLLLALGLLIFCSGLLVHSHDSLLRYAHVPGSVLLIAGHVLHLRGRPSCAVRVVPQARA